MPQPYDQRLSRRYPGLFVILIDQSGSMSEPITNMGGVTKADFAASALNEIMYEMVKQGKFDATTGKPRKYAYLSVFGYGSTVYSLLTPNGEPIDIPYISANPKRYDTRTKEVYDSSVGNYVQASERVPIWIEARAEGQTEMAHALVRARDVINYWLAETPEQQQGLRQDSFPPIVLNITDGHHQGAGDPLLAAQDVMRTGTSFGNTLLYNCHFTKDLMNPTVFPSQVAQVASLNPHSAQLFDMSSLIPDNLRSKAEAVTNGQPVEPGARGMVYNTDASMLVRFLRWGTIGTTGIES